MSSAREQSRRLETGVHRGPRRGTREVEGSKKPQAKDASESPRRHVEDYREAARTQGYGSLSDLLFLTSRGVPLNEADLLAFLELMDRTGVEDIDWRCHRSPLAPCAPRTRHCSPRPARSPGRCGTLQTTYQRKRRARASPRVIVDLGPRGRLAARQFAPTGAILPDQCSKNMGGAKQLLSAVNHDLMHCLQVLVRLVP